MDNWREQTQRMEDDTYLNFAFLPEEKAQADQVKNGNEAGTGLKARIFPEIILILLLLLIIIIRRRRRRGGYSPQYLLHRRFGG